MRNSTPPRLPGQADQANNLPPLNFLSRNLKTCNFLNHFRVFNVVLAGSLITGLNMNMKTLPLLAAALFFGTTAFAAEKDKDNSSESFIRKTFNVSPGGKLTIRADRGSIDVKTAATDKVEIEVTREPGRGAASDLLEKHLVTINQDGNDVIVEARMNGVKNNGWFRGNNLKVHYDVTVPAKYNVNLKTSGGGITVSDLDGEARSETSGGSLKFGQIKGPVHGRTSGGSINVTGATQDVDIETSGGSIHVGDTGGNVIAKTSGGSIHVDHSKGSVTAETSGGGIEVNGAAGPVNAHTSGGPIHAALTQQPSGPCTFETSGGGIEVKMASNVAIDLDAQTSGGSVSTEFPVTVQGELKKNHLRSKLNGGGPKVTLGTSGGSIRIKKI
jgi:DUF4097 and DUF4098 domain-containing protein YvlB